MSEVVNPRPPTNTARRLANQIKLVPGWWSVTIGKGSDNRCWAWRWYAPDSAAYVVHSWEQFCAYRAVVEAECGPAPAGVMPTGSRRLPPSRVENAPVQLTLPGVPTGSVRQPPR